VQRDATTHGLEAGTVAEVRVARAWFWDGYYVRRGVDLQHKFGSDISTVTDLDLLAFSFDQALVMRKYIGEVKSGKSNNTPRPLDRALWARGLRELVGADGAEVTTAFHPSISVREFSASFNVTIQHMDDLAAREKRLNVGEVNDVGSQGEILAGEMKQIQLVAKRSPELERAFWFLKSEVWFLEPFDALKRLLGLLRRLGTMWPAESDSEAMRAIRWFFAETNSIATLQLVIIAGKANTMDQRAFSELAVGKLAAGSVPVHEMHRLSERVDEYVTKLLTSLDAPMDVRVGSLGAFRPEPPDYTEPLLELVHRLASSAAVVSRLPRQMDAIMFQRLYWRRDVALARKRLELDADCERFVRLIGAFLRGQFQLPAPVEKVLSASLTGPPQVGDPGAADADKQPDLFSES
jgi:hypothetical protein